MPQVLLIDDDLEAIEWMSEFITGLGYTVSTATSLRAARIQLTRSRPELVLTDLMGYSSEEAGRILGVKAVTARVLASQAQAAMRRTIGAIDG